MQRAVLIATTPFPALLDRYRPLFIWGQLVGWYKQTVYDPSASLSADRRGTLSLPDVESCSPGSRGKYRCVNVRLPNGQLLPRGQKHIT